MLSKSDIILYNSLLEETIIDKSELEPLAREAENSGESLQDLLIRRNIMPESEVLNILSKKLRIARVDLKTSEIDKPAIEKIPVKVASYYKFIPLQIKNGILTVAVSSPLNIKKQDEIRTQLGYGIEMVLSCRDDIEEALKRYYGLAADTLDEIASGTSGGEAASLKASHDKVEDIEKLAGDASVIRLVNQIILEAYRKRATDIHIEPYRGGVALRYRIDGVLYDAKVPIEIKNFLNAIISRIKIMSNLNIVERRLPQDGRAVVRVQDHVLDLRISTMPTPHGESVVIRILPTQMLYSLESLGLAKRDLDAFEKIIEKPHGIIFVTGPTGSGKTTTLYACLSRINTKDRKIITIEDPIEYEMAGITQIQVMPEIGLDFARGLRSMLRHDPDIMMVGEVRDLETAEIAIRVALTGHLVFSTLHTNDAASGVARLLDIGLEPYLVSSSIEAIIAQRLVRVICPHCKYEDKKIAKDLKDHIAKELGLASSDDIKVFKGKGCQRCNNTGFFGRTAMYEILLVDDVIRDLISKRTPSGIMKRAAIKRSMRTLRQSGWEKVTAGVTTPEEVMKVTQIEEYSEEKPLAPEPAVEKSRKDLTDQQIPGDEAEASPADRRTYVRVSTNINLHYKIFESQKELDEHRYVPEHVTNIKNISAGGILFESRDPLPIGSIAELVIELPDGKNPIECLSRITRVTEKVLDKIYETGVCFLDITGIDKNRIKSYIEKRLK